MIRRCHAVDDDKNLIIRRIYCTPDAARAPTNVSRYAYFRFASRILLPLSVSGFFLPPNNPAAAPAARARPCCMVGDSEPEMLPTPSPPSEMMIVQSASRRVSTAFQQRERKHSRPEILYTTSCVEFPFPTSRHYSA